MTKKDSQPAQEPETEELTTEELAKELDAQISEAPDRKMPPLVSWTIKLKHPGSDEADFIRIEEYNDPVAVANLVTNFRNHLLSTGYEEATRGGKKSVAVTAPQPSAEAKPAASSRPAAPPQTGSEPLVADADGSDMVWQAELSRRVDGRLELAVWGYLGDGTQMQYPLLRYITTPEHMHEALVPVLWEDLITEEQPLPIRADVEWLAHWKQGRPTGKGGHYKDLIALEVAP